MNLKTIITSTALAALATGAQAQARINPPVGEVAVVADSGVRTRGILSAQAQLGRVGVDFLGLNEATNWNADTYSGRQMLTVSFGNKWIQPNVSVPTDKNGAGPAWYGIRSPQLAKALGAADGWVDIVAGKNGVQLMAFYDKNIGKVHAYTVAMPTFKREGTNGFYSETQVERPLNSNVKIFGRHEYTRGVAHDFMTGVRANW